MRKAIIAIVAAGLPGPAAAQCFDLLSCYSAPARQMSQQPYTPQPMPPVSDPYIKPLPIIPPIGTRQCTPVYVCDGQGVCRWQQACR